MELSCDHTHRGMSTCGKMLSGQLSSSFSGVLVEDKQAQDFFGLPAGCCADWRLPAGLFEEVHPRNRDPKPLAQTLAERTPPGPINMIEQPTHQESSRF